MGNSALRGSLVKGDKGDTLVFNDLTQEQKDALKGAKGDAGDKGDKGDAGDPGAKGDTGAGYPSRAVSTEDTVNSASGANTLADVTGLSFPVVSGTTYYFKAFIRYTAQAATTGSRWVLNGPTLTSLTYWSTYTLTATSRTYITATAWNIPAASNASSLTAGNLAIIEGTVTPSENGTVQVRFASEISGSAITAKAGSYIEYWT